MRRPQRFAFHLSIGLIVLALSLAGGGSSSHTRPDPALAAQAVDTGEYYFQPAQLTVAVGEAVTWTNSGGEAHTISPNDGSWGTDDLEPGASYSHTFTTPGTYHYMCQIHDGQEGTLTVR